MCGLGCVLGGLVVFGVAIPASGHAEVAWSSPAAGAVLRAPPRQVVVAFEERPDPVLSKLEVRDGSGALRRGGRVTSAPDRPDGLSMPVPVLPDGVYEVSWRTVSAVDGHLETGSFSFGVRVPVAALRLALSERAAGPSWAGVGARSVYYLGVSGLIGVAFVSLAVFRAPPERVVRWGLCLAWVAGVTGAIGVAAAQASTAGGGLGRLLSSSVGPGAMARVVPLVEAALPIAVVVAWGGGSRRAGLAAVAGYAALSMLADVHASHAAAADSWAWLHMAVLWAHFVAVAIWIGGLAVVVACLPGIGRARRAEGLMRYSAVACVAVFVVAGTGMVEATAEVGTWRALVSTGFGRLVLAKVGIIVVLAALGAVNRYRNIPRVSRSPAPLRRVALIEVGLAVGALAAAALLSNLSPAGPARETSTGAEPALASPLEFAVPLSHAPILLRPGYGSADVGASTAGPNRWQS